METLSPHEQKLHRTLLQELTKGELSNKVGRRVHSAGYVNLVLNLSCSYQVKLGTRAPAKLRSLALDTHDTLPAHGSSKARIAPRESRPAFPRQVLRLL